LPDYHGISRLRPLGIELKRLRLFCSQERNQRRKHRKDLHSCSLNSGPPRLDLTSDFESNRRNLLNNSAKYETLFPSCHVAAEDKESGNAESRVEVADRASGLIHGGSFRSSKWPPYFGWLPSSQQVARNVET